jgi:predicted nuclease of predicted toxin-antitoxin system
MRVKLDENLGKRGEEILRGAACDVQTVVAQELCSAADATLIEICRVEARVLISLDKDFANTLRFRPSRFAGIVVLRLPEPLRREDIHDALSRFLSLSKTRSPVGKLWLVDSTRIREFAEETPDL